MDYIITALVSYLFGSIPFGYLFTKLLLKKDIRDVGSGNIGATNVLRTGNKSLGYLTLVLDIAKAVVPVIYIKFNYPDLIYISALCAFFGLATGLGFSETATFGCDILWPKTLIWPDLIKLSKSEGCKSLIPKSEP